MRYFDYAATCPMDDSAIEAYSKAAQSYYGNTESLHDFGTQAETLLTECRGTIAQLLGGEAEGICFTSGGTESNFLGIHALLQDTKAERNHIIVSQAEHASIQNIAAQQKREGNEVTYIPYTKEGTIDLELLEAALQRGNAVVAIQHVNPELGTIQPVQAVSALCKDYRALLHVDGVQAFGKVDVADTVKEVHSYAISSHKVYGPKGVGALYICPRISVRPLLPNGTHENGMRPGTVNTPGIVAFTVAAQGVMEKLGERVSIYTRLHSRFKQQLHPVEDCIDWIIPSSIKTIPSVIGLCVKQVEGQWMMLEGNRRGFAFSTGSACHVNSQTPTATLTAMGIGAEEARTFIRISFGKDHTEEDIDALCSCLVETIEERYNIMVK
ncbi:IscS subfamily cysteine desulfurase [Pontibacillus salicampi]|uniref:IscS subfamily cysteine desulfurase n=1 Tax=Pontibacillus salicampi TaxID=1449801 RepID=A0ABV6LPS7_9BACI